MATTRARLLAESLARPAPLACRAKRSTPHPIKALLESPGKPAAPAAPGLKASLLRAQPPAACSAVSGLPVLSAKRLSASASAPVVGVKQATTRTEERRGGTES